MGMPIPQTPRSPRPKMRPPSEKTSKMICQHHPEPIQLSQNMPKPLLFVDFQLIFQRFRSMSVASGPNGSRDYALALRLAFFILRQHELGVFLQHRLHVPAVFQPHVALEKALKAMKNKGKRP